jgi:sugar lactone lactonase YvrE
MGQQGVAHVLRTDGTLAGFDTASGALVGDVYRVPSGFQALDLAVGPAGRGVVRCLTLLRRTSAPASFLLQIFEGGREVWTWLPSRGVYVGVAVDEKGEYAYVTNSTDKTIYRVTIGREKAPVETIVRLDDAERLGALALDPKGHRLIAADVDSDRIFLVAIGGPQASRVLKTQVTGDIRGLAWDPFAQRILLADSGRESLWAVDPARPGATPRRLTDKRFRDPSGVAVAADRTVWLVDEGAGSAFQVAPDLSAVRRAIELNAAKK